MVKILRESEMPKRVNKVTAYDLIVKKLGLNPRYKDYFILGESFDGYKRANCKLSNVCVIAYNARSVTDGRNMVKRMLQDIGARYITFSSDNCYFYLDITPFKEEAVRVNEENEENYQAMKRDVFEQTDIEQYRPTEAIINKLIDYRDRGSAVNVKAIKDPKKAMTYYYASLMIDWKALQRDIRQYWCDPFNRERRYNVEMSKMDETVMPVEEYSDKRTEDEKHLGLGNFGGMFTFDYRHENGKVSCWLPKSVFELLAKNNVPAHVLKRTNGSMYDRNGRQWSEIEHLVLFPGTKKEARFDIVVHTNEGGGPDKYSAWGTKERAGIGEVLDSLQMEIDKLNARYGE